MSPHTHEYVHGRTESESTRLHDQAQMLAELLHHDTRYAAGSTVPEAGCGVGAQTAILARNSPGAAITSVDNISGASIRQARERIAGVRFCQADVMNLPFADGCFDHAFVCFVLEHPTNPFRALCAMQRWLKPGGIITAIERGITDPRTSIRRALRRCRPSGARSTSRQRWAATA